MTNNIPDEPEEIKIETVVEDDPNMIKVPQMQYTKMNLKINELETKIGGYEMTMGVLQKEKEAMENNNEGLKKMIEELQQKIKESSTGDVSIIRNKVYQL
jgi:chromosome segregation ATPase